MVKATIRHKNLTELEGDVILGTAILYGAIGNSETFIIGDVECSNIPVILAANAVVLLKEIFSGKELEKAYEDFYIAFLAAVDNLTVFLSCHRIKYSVLLVKSLSQPEPLPSSRLMKHFQTLLSLHFSQL